MSGLLRKWLYRIRLHHVALIAIVGLGLWLRLHNLSQTVWFFGGMDEARDVLVAKHIIEYREFIDRGPFAAGGYFWLENSPLYYYLIAVIWFFGRSAIGCVILWALLQSSGIVLSYWAGKLTRSTGLGLLAAILYAIHPSTIIVANQIIQPHLLPLFALSFYCSLLMAWKQKSPKWLLWAGLWLLLPLHFHYAGILLWCGGGLALAFSWYQAWKQNWSSWQMYLFYSCLISINIVLLWAVLTYKYKLFDQTYFFTLNKYKLADPFIDRVHDAAFRFTNLMFGYITHQTGLLYLGGLIVAWWVERKNQTEYFLFGLCASICLALGFKSFIAETYLLSFLPFFILLWAGALLASFKRKWWLGVLVALITILWWKNATTIMYRDWPEQSFYRQYKIAAQAIHQDYFALAAAVTPPKLPQFTVAELASYTGIQYDGWQVGPFWFFLEDLTGQKLVKLTSYDTNFYPLGEKFDYVYLICDRRNYPERAQDMCFNTFTKYRDYLTENVTIYDHQDLIIWRFQIDQTKKPDQIYHVYREYMY